MWKLWVAAIIAWNIIPYKAWSRVIFGYEGFNLGDLVFLVIAIPSIGSLFVDAKKNRLFLWILLIWGVCIISILKGMFFQEPMRDMFRVVRAELFWVIVPMMVANLTSEQSFKRWLLGMSVVLIIASLTIVVFSYYPQLIPVDDEMGSWREEDFGGFERTFTNGMVGVFAGAVVALCSVLLRTNGRLGSLFIFFIMIIGVILTFTRTFYFGIIIAAILVFINSWKKVITSILGLAVAGFLIYQIIGFPEFVTNLFSAAFERLEDLMEADFLNPDPTDSRGFGSLIWRLEEIMVALSEFHNPLDKLTGLLGHNYQYFNLNPSLPHHGYFAIYYCHGGLGVIAYAGLLGIMTLRLWNNMKTRSSSNISWVPIAAFVCWICLLVMANSGPLFQSALGVSVLAFIVGLSEAATRIMQSNERSSHEFADHFHSHPKF